MNSYMISFPGISVANRAQSVLRREGYRSSVGRSSPGLSKSCAFALYPDTGAIQDVLRVLRENAVSYSGVFIRDGGVYRKIE